MPGSKLAVALWRLRERVYIDVRLYYQRTPLSKPMEVESPPPEGLEFHRIRYDNVDLIREWKGPFYVRRFRALLNRGYIGLYGIRDGKVVVYVWMVVKLDAWSPACWHDPLDVGEVMGGRIETRSEYRRQEIGIHARAQIHELLRQLYGDRLKQQWGTILFENIPMQELAAQVGSIRCKEEHLVVILGHLFLARVWHLVPNTSQRIGRGRLTIRIKIPDFLFSPAFKWLGLGPQPQTSLTTNQADASEPTCTG
jgi:hypothetical protein